MSSPFVYEEPVAPGDLAGRDDELRTLVDRALDGRNSRLEGPRRFGKTSLLRAALAAAEKDGAVPIDIRPADWVRNLRLPDGRPARLDLYGHNPFSFRNADLRNRPSQSVDLSDLDWFSELVQRQLGRPRGKRVRLFASEFTMPTAPGDREFNLFVTPHVQARWITKAFRIMRAVDADGLGWIHLRDEPPLGERRVIRGGLLTHDGRPKPGFYAFMRGR